MAHCNMQIYTLYVNYLKDFTKFRAAIKEKMHLEIVYYHFQHRDKNMSSKGKSSQFKRPPPPPPIKTSKRNRNIVLICTSAYCVQNTKLYEIPCRLTDEQIDYITSIPLATSLRGVY